MEESLRLDNQLCFALYASQRAMVAAYQPELGPLGLTYPQYLVLLVLWEEDGLPVNRIGERLRLDSGTLTPLLKRLEAGKLVRRVRSAEDQRRVEVHLTARGQALQARARRIPTAMACKVDLGRGELGALRAALHRITHRLDSSSEPEAIDRDHKEGAKKP